MMILMTNLNPRSNMDQRLPFLIVALLIKLPKHGSEKVNYSNFSLWEVSKTFEWQNIVDDRDVKILEEGESDVNLLVSPEKRIDFIRSIESNKVPYSLITDNMQELLEEDGDLHPLQSNLDQVVTHPVIYSSNTDEFEEHKFHRLNEVRLCVG